MLNFSTYSDEQLLRLLSEDNQQAFSEIYERYWEKLFVSAEKILQNRAAAQDAVQEVFISLWNRRSTLQIESLQNYLYQAARFQVFKNIRSEKTGNDFFKRLALVSNEIIKEDPAALKELERMIEKIIASLPEDQRIIFKMNRDQGLTYKQIAAEKNISVKTVEKKISQALKYIRMNMTDTLFQFIF